MNGFQRVLPWVSLGLCAALAALMLIDLIWPGLYLFLREPTKYFALVTVLMAALCSAIVIARARRAQRRAGQRRR